MLEEEQQKEAQNNQQQQQIHSQVILPSTITATSHQNQVPNISHRNNDTMEIIIITTINRMNRHRSWW